MTFDYILMNPPYNRNLHLKILASIFNYISKDGTIINLSPVRWAIDPLSKYKKDGFSQYRPLLASLKSLEVADTKDFDAEFGVDLGVSVFNINAVPLNIDEYIWANRDRQFYETIRAKAPGFIKNYADIEPQTEYFVKLPGVHGHKGKPDEFDLISPKKEKCRTRENTGELLYVSFNTDEEAENFRLSLLTDFYKKINRQINTNLHVQWAHIPFMIDYKKPWTEERLYEYFFSEP